MPHSAASYILEDRMCLRSFQIEKVPSSEAFFKRLTHREEVSAFRIALRVTLQFDRHLLHAFKDGLVGLIAKSQF